ncbi:MAG: hypothetical protein BGO32_05185 [Bacteroidetes bacterium 37-13]|nr:MAG: hypothetical protein BGO32_05185 [Bacteroidetes bacterium 37-13]
MAEVKYRFLKRNQINDEKWDNCIHQNSDLPYALSWFLDCVAEDWAGLVLRDYEAVFPIVMKKKLGFRIVYNPFFCQQLGLISDGTHPSFEDTCLRFLQRKFSFCDINLHYKSIAESSKMLSLRYNYILPLDKDYETLKESYSKNTIRNLMKTKLYNVFTEPFQNVEQFALYYEKNSAVNVKGYSRKHTKILQKLIGESTKRGMGEMIAAYSVPQNPPIALAFFLKYKNRIINLAPITLKESRQAGAMAFILDEMIQKNANSEFILDFEGSSVENIARFYKGFGSKQQNFWTYRHTLLDTFLQPFKGSSNLL